MEILDEYRKHCEFLKENIELKTEKQKRELILALIEFCFLIPNFEKAIKKHISIDLEKGQLIERFNDNNLNSYRTASKKLLDEIDEYADDYEEVDSMDLLILNMFEYLLIKDKNKCIFNLFNGVIEVLDYYEQFSERTEYWNEKLENELFRQRKLLELKKVNLNIYSETYKTVIFENL